MNLMVPEVMGMLRRGLRTLPILLTLVLVAALTSCNTTKYMTGGDELLVGQTVKIEDPKNVDNRSDVAYALSTLAQQQPNGNFLLLWPREYFYLDNNKPGDTTSIDRFLRGTIGQPPAIYNDSLSRRSAAKMADYLRYLGYFNARAYHEPDRARKKPKLNLIYHVIAGRRYLIDTVEYFAPTPDLDSLLQAALPESLLAPGTPLDLNQFDQEKSRLSRLLRNEGYAFFTGSYFDQLEVDTTVRSGYANLRLSIRPPPRPEAYRRYRVGQLTVYTDYDATVLNGTYALDTIIDGVRMVSSNPEFRIRPEILRRSIFLRPGEFHSREDFERTNLSLNGLGSYRFVRINQSIDSLREDVLNYQLQLSPGKQMSFGADLEVSYTNRSGAVGADNLIGLAVQPSFQNRNVFGGAELLTATLRGGIEVAPFRSNNRSAFFNTVDLAADVSLSVPRFRDFGLYSFLSKVPAPWRGNLIGQGTLQKLRERASTRYSTGYEYLLIQRFYSYTIFNARLGYDFRKSTVSNYRINHLAVDILDPSTEPQFERILEENQFLDRSFGQQYFFSALFRSLEYNRLGRVDQRGRSINLSARVETAGAEVLAAEEVANLFREEDQRFRPSSEGIFARYYLGEANLRLSKQYTPTSSLAARLLVAAARPFGGADDVPYVKQFFVGGANSMRAWAPRGLGPGGYVDELSLNTDNNLRLFQTGDLRLEFNLEYRFPLFSFFRGALFTDIGNVWTFNEDLERPGSQFRLTKKPVQETNIIAQPFYRQLAVGVGTGLRVDLSYFIFRLDASIPVRYNYPQLGQGQILERFQENFSERDYWRRFNSFGLRDVTFQLGLGYPF